jgi:hypothetical protein
MLVVIRLTSLITIKPFNKKQTPAFIPFNFSNHRSDPELIRSRNQVSGLVMARVRTSTKLKQGERVWRILGVLAKLASELVFYPDNELFIYIKTMIFRY